MTFAALLSILIGVLSVVMGGVADPLSNIVTTVTTPFRSGIAAAADWVEGVYGYVFHYGELEQELKDTVAKAGYSVISVDSEPYEKKELFSAFRR